MHIRNEIEKEWIREATIVISSKGYKRIMATSNLT